MNPNWKYEYHVEQIKRTFHVMGSKKYRLKKHENFVITSFIHDKALADLKPFTQFYVPGKNKEYFLIDLYYPQINLAIEIDEEHHSNLISADKRREELINQNIDCQFERINIEKDDVQKRIQEIKGLLIAKKKECIAKGDFEEWTPPNYWKLEEAKKELTNTLFIKIRGKIAPEKLHGRQTCCWPLAKHKVPKIKTVIVAHDRVITRVFKNPVFSKSSDVNKFCYTADEDKDHELLGSQIIDWKSQNTWTYSHDIK